MAQIHPMSGKWLCVTSKGEELSWTSSDGPMTVEECQGMCYSYINLLLFKATHLGTLSPHL